MSAPYRPGSWAGPTRPPSRTMAGWSLATGIAGLICWGSVGMIGIGLGIAVLASANQGRPGIPDRGSARMAFGGVVLGWLGSGWLAIAFGSAVVPLFFGGHYDSLTVSDEVQADPTIVEPSAVGVGQCLTDPGIDHPELDSVLRVVPCDQPHDGRAFASLQLRGDAYPGRKAVRRRASERCDREAAVATAAPAPSDYWIWFPSADSWRAGDRHVLCVLVEGAAVGPDGSTGA